MTRPDLATRILYRDQLIIVLDKPAGIPVHAGPSGGESLEDYFDDLRFDYKETPRLAHRLDRDTSGCLVLGRNDRALRKMGRLFESGRINKTYWAVTDKPPSQKAGLIDLPLRKVKLPKGWTMQPAGINDPDAQTAQTEYKILSSKPDGTTLIELHPLTGRTHQIRVHLQALDCPIRGDWLYGPAPERPETFERLCLHAKRIEIPLYEDKDAIVVEAPAPDIMKI